MVDISFDRDINKKNKSADKITKSEEVNIKVDLKRIDSGVYLDDDISLVSIKAPALNESKKQAAKVKKQEIELKHKPKIGDSVIIARDLGNVAYYASWLTKPIVNIIKSNIVKIVSKSIGPIRISLGMVADIWYIQKHFKKYLRIRNIRNNFIREADLKVYFSEIKGNLGLINREKEIKEELDKLRKIRIRNIVLKDRVISIKEINRKIESKQKELNHVEEYMAIKNLNDVNKERIKKELLSISYGITALGSITFTVVNPLLGLAALGTILLCVSYGLFGLAYKKTVRDSVVGYLANKVKGIKGRDMVSKIRDIQDSEVNFDVIRESRLSGDTFLERDFNILKKILGDDVHVLQNLGKNFINLNEFEKIINFVDKVKESDIDSLLEEKDKARIRVVIGDLENRIRKYKELLNNMEYDSIKLYNPVFDSWKKVKIRYPLYTGRFRILYYLKNVACNLLI